MTNTERKPRHPALPRWRLALLLILVPGTVLQAQVDGLAAALRATLANHPAVAGKQAELQASDFGVSDARSQRLPSISVQAAQYAADNRSILSSDDLSNPVTFRIRQPVWTFGRISSDIDAAEAELDRESADLFRVRRELLTETALAYADVQGAMAQVAAAEENLEQLEVLHDQIQRRADGELASDADTRLAGTRLAQGQVLLARLHGEVELARNALQSLTQVPLAASQVINPSLLSLPDAPTLEQRVLAQSAELQLRQRDVAMAEAEVGKARSSAMPTVYLQAEKFHDQPGLRDDNQVSLVIEAGLQGLGFSTRHRSSAAGARQVAAEQNLRAATLQLQEDTRRLLQMNALQATLVAAQRATLEDLESLLESYRRQYESGRKSWLEVLNIQRELNEQRMQLIQANRERLRYTLELLALSGGLDDLAGLEAADE